VRISQRLGVVHFVDDEDGAVNPGEWHPTCHRPRCALPGVVLWAPLAAGLCCPGCPVRQHAGTRGAARRAMAPSSRHSFTLRLFACCAMQARRPRSCTR
jgi:hypothetical protein